jgi:hypothetical protein
MERLLSDNVKRLRHPVLSSRALPAPTDVLSIVIKVVLFSGYSHYRSPLPLLRPGSRCVEVSCSIERFDSVNSQTATEVLLTEER